jgi:hypothetical protein
VAKIALIFRRKDPPGRRVNSRIVITHIMANTASQRMGVTSIPLTLRV